MQIDDCEVSSDVRFIFQVVIEVIKSSIFMQCVLFQELHKKNECYNKQWQYFYNN